MDTNLLLSILALPVCAILVTVWGVYLNRRDEAAFRRTHESGDPQP